jgi:hypothetical protein
MFKRVLSVVLVGLLIGMVGVRPAHAESKEEKEARFIEKIKEGISRLGTGTDARVEVKLQDKRKLKGYIRETREDGFVVVDAKTGVATTVAYPQVKGVKGRNNAIGSETVITIAVVSAIILIGILAGRAAK